VSVGTRPVRVLVAVVALLLIPLLLLGATVANWVAVDQAVHAALWHLSEDHHHFIENYADGVRGFMILGGVLEFGIIVALLPTVEAVLEGRRWGRTRALTVAWFTIWCGFGELTINPIANVRWSGDPDGESIVSQYFPGWHWPTLLVLVALVGLCHVTATVLLAITRSADFRRARDSA
jgi:hypothetical protein